MLISRRTMICAGAGAVVGLSGVQASHPQALPRFLPKNELLRCIGVFNPFGFAIATGGRYTDAAYMLGYSSWRAAFPPSLLESLRARHVSGLRLSVDPGPLLATRDDAAIDRHLATIIDCIEAITAVGLRCHLDVHIQPAWFSAVTGWGDIDLIDGPDGPKFQRLVRVECAIARRLSERCDPSQVAMELFNEPPRKADFARRQPWPVQLKALYDEVRSAAPNLTLILSPADFGNPLALDEIDPTVFDANTMFSIHCYEPYTFTFQSLSGNWIGNWTHLPLIKRLPFPPNRGDKEREIARFAGAVEAEHKLGLVEKQATLLAGRQALSAYFDRPQDGAFIGGIMDVATRWADSHGVARARLLLGEFGAWGSADAGADMSSKVNYYATVVKEAKRSGINWSVHELEDPNSKWRITDDQQNLIADYMTALGFV